MQKALRELLTQALAQNPRAIIGIDGPAGSGKSTLALEIAEYLSGQELTCHCLHMDDLYDGWDLPINENFYERLRAIINEHHQGSDLHYATYDWERKVFSTPIAYPAAHVLILEGVGSCGRAVRDELNLSIWIEVESSLGLKRVLQREPYLTHALIARWQIIESDHFLADATANSLDIRLSTNPQITGADLPIH